MIVRLAWREIRNNRRFSFFFVLNLALGLFGFLALDAFKASLHASLAQRSQDLLGADIAVTARRPFSTQEESALASALAGARVTTARELYSMVVSPSTSRLVEIVAVEKEFPFYGPRILSGDERRVWLQEDLALQLGVKTGDELKIGHARFVVAELLSRDSGSSARGFALASRIYISLARLPETKLLQTGSTVFYRQLYQLPPGQDSLTLARDLNKRLSDPGLRVVSHQDASRMVGRLQNFLNDYLGLAALVSLFLSSIGAAYLFRTFLARRVKDIAILISLGARPALARRVYLVQLVLLGILSAIVSALGVWVLLPGVIRVLASFVNYPIEPVILWSNAALALAMGMSASLLVCLPFVTRLRGMNAAQLFQEDAMPEAQWSRRSLFALLPALAFFMGLAMWQSRSWVTGSLFVGICLTAALLLGLAGGFVMKGLSPSGSVSLPWRLAMRNLSRSRVSSLSGFLAIGLGALLINLIPQIQKSLVKEVEAPDVSEVPSLFVFDIQPEQVSPLQDLLNKEGFQLQSLTPLVRARLIAINSRPFEKETGTAEFQTREEETQTRFRNRSMNLTWRAGLSESEKMVAGREFSVPAENRVPEISVEQRFAKRLELQLGDVLMFDVQGVEVQGKIVNLRSVKWTSFQPNFFVQFEPGVIDEAPATWLASIGKMDRDSKFRVQNQIVGQFSNISIIDISQVVEKILTIFSQMAWAIRAMAILSLFAGFTVLFSIASHQAATRRQEINLLKILGMRFETIQRIFQLEFGGLGFLAAAGGGLLSVGASWLISSIVFDRVWVLAWGTPVVLTLLVTVLSVATARIAAGRVLRQKPAALLQSDL